MKRPPWLAAIINWVFRATALREARGRIALRNETQTRALSQAKLLMEVARRVTRPVEPLPAGSSCALLVSLYREAVYWLLLSLHPVDGEPPDLATLWAMAPPERLLAPAGESPTLDALRRSLVEQGVGASLGATDRDVSRARMFAEALLRDVDSTDRLVARLLIQRWRRVALLGMVVVPVVLGVQMLLRGPDLAAGRPFRLSSTFYYCNPCGALRFHTQDQSNPWVDFDLGAVKKIHRVEVHNRSDCCAERAVPLIAEVSVDDQHWVEAARRDTVFSDWTASFPPQRARYVRLRVPGQTILHLEKVSVR